ncbi:response regulator [Rhizobium sp. S152]|uniref:response regulator n=1 Tax=Rhizobium sp. S152 TaxID=3055038 RepID=UPI0025AA12A1|nr:response regulator [Rhizobium sp. S152]MDM9627658.1 response regulator [Rhizobium sp. S152]
MQHDDYNWISVRAHEIWQSEGCPGGRDREHWTQAVAEWKGREHSSEAPSNTLRDHVNRVLVVDDEPLIRFAAVEALEDAGFEVLEAGNADEALVLLQQNDVDAVFTDVNMPGTTDGLGLMAHVRARSPQTRVIVTSGHVRLGAFDLSSGVSFIPKPYRHDVIVGMLKAPGN